MDGMRCALACSLIRGQLGRRVGGCSIHFGPSSMFSSQFSVWAVEVSNVLQPEQEAKIDAVRDSGKSQGGLGSGSDLSAVQGTDRLGGCSIWIPSGH